MTFFGRTCISLLLSGFAVFGACATANAVEPECLPANICGYSYYVIQENGDLVGWGDNGPSSYQDAEVLMENTASIVPGNLRITLAIGQDRTLRAMDGSACTNFSDPAPLLENVAAARCGLNHYLALQEDGTLYVGGRNESGQLGTGEADTLEHGPTKLLSGVISVATWDNCSYAVLDDGTLLFWGKPEGHSVCAAPTAIGSGFIQLLSGEYVLSADHTLYKMGWEENTDRFSLTPIMESVLYASKNLVILEDGSLWCLDENAPLVPAEYVSVAADAHTPVMLMEEVSYVTVGPFYSIVILQDESMWLLPNQDLISSNPEGAYEPLKLMDHAPLPQIEPEQIDPQGNRAADFPSGSSNQGEYPLEVSGPTAAECLSSSGAAAALLTATAIVCVALVQLRRKLS